MASVCRRGCAFFTLFCRTAPLAGALLCATLVQAVEAPRAPEQPIKAIRLTEAVRLALTNNPTLLAAKARVAAAQADAAVPRAAWLPRVAGTAQLIGGTTNNSTAMPLSSPGVDLPRIGGTPTTAAPDWSPSPASLLAVTLRQELYDFGRIAALSAAADMNVNLEGTRAEAERLELELTTREAYAAVQVARAIMKSAEAGFERAEVNRSSVVASIRQGLQRQSELARAEAEVARANVGRVRATGALRSAQGILAAVVGTGDLLLDAADTGPEDVALPPLDEVLNRALKHDPGIREAEARLALQQLRTRSIEAETRPDLQLSATVSGRAGGAVPSREAEPQASGWLPTVPNYHLGLVLNWPLFDASVARRRAAAESTAMVRQQEIEARRVQLRAQVHQVYLAAELAKQTWAALERSAVAARTNDQQIRARFEAGLGTSLELADASSLQTDADIQLAVGRFEYARARARLSRLMAEWHE